LTARGDTEAVQARATIARLPVTFPSKAQAGKPLPAPAPMGSAEGAL